MNYQETIQYLYSALPMYQRIGAPAYKADLANAHALDEYFAYPHKKFKSIHVAGTNGKGSVSHMLASVLQEEGYKVGLFTSPHLVDFRERIRINGKPVSEEFVIDFTEKHMPKFESLGISFFEMTVFMAFAYFEFWNIDIALIEVGLGGRLDTTNVIQPELSLITNIGLDHMQFLGQELKSIAKEKGGIIKNRIPLIVGENQSETLPIFIEIANTKSAELRVAEEGIKIEYSLRNIDGLIDHKLEQIYAGDIGKISCDLLGMYQQKNIVTALAALDKLNEIGIKAGNQSILKGFKKVKENTGLMGRWQEVGHDPLIICDIAHNTEGFIYIIDQLANTPYKKLHMILGFVNDKDLGSIIQLLPENANYTLCEPGVARAMRKKDLSILFKENKLNFSMSDNIQNAFNAAREAASPEDLIYIGGSTFLVADFLAWKKNNKSF